MLRAVIAVLPVAEAHGWVTLPVSKNELAYHHYSEGMPNPNGGFRYEPQTSNLGNGIGEMSNTGGSACGAKEAGYTEGLGTWRAFYDKAGVTVPQISPGSKLGVHVELTIDHGGQAWVELACADKIADSNNWTVLERHADDRSKHFMPSSPGAFAWAPMEFGDFKSVYAEWVVPEDLAPCTSGMVGRWVWKTSNTCNDFNNIARPTAKFTHDEYLKVVQDYIPYTHWVNPACKTPPEEFISCMDFDLVGNATLMMGDAPLLSRRGDLVV